MRKQTFCIRENKDADQLCGNREADQRLCFRYIENIIPLLSKAEISSLKPSAVAVQPGLCWTWSETRTLVFSRRGSFITVPDLQSHDIIGLLTQTSVEFGFPLCFKTLHFLVYYFILALNSISLPFVLYKLFQAGNLIQCL